MLVLHKPLLSELWFKKKLLSDPETMSYNLRYGGTIDFPESRWPSWYEAWIGCTDGSKFYSYLKDKDSGEFIGEAAYHFEDGRCMADMIVLAGYRGRGYGREGLELLLSAAKKNGIKVMYDEIDISSKAGIFLFESEGFERVSETDYTVIFKKELTKED